MLEVNPRASRTVPFVAKATGMPVAKIAAKVMAGVSLAELGIDSDPIPSHVSVKESVFPFRKFLGVDIVLGPEMRSTGEVMGISERFSIAFAKSQLAAGTVLPQSGTIFISVAPPAKEHMVGLARRLTAMGFKLMATEGTARRLEEAGVPVRARLEAAGRASEPDRLSGRRPDSADHEHAQRQGSPHRRRPHPRRRRGRTACPASPPSKPPTPPCGRWKPCGTKRSRSKRCKIASPQPSRTVRLRAAGSRGWRPAIALQTSKRTPWASGNWSE